MQKIKTNSPRAWLLAARPKTLTGAIVPVAIALVLAFYHNPIGFQFIPAMLCLAFAAVMQIDANLVNDYFDCLKGVDGEDRLGPERACQQGWITLPAMRKGLLFVTALSALIGLPLIKWGGWEMLLVGVACIVFCYLYTTLLSGKAMGDVLVIIFFGLVPVCVTYYIQTGTISESCLLAAIGCGCAIDNLLIVNNFRDRETDKQHGKTTLVTLIGGKTALVLYLLCAMAAFALGALSAMRCRPISQAHGYDIVYESLVPYLLVVAASLLYMYRTWTGRSLNKALGMTSLSILLYGLGLVLAILM